MNDKLSSLSLEAKKCLDTIMEKASGVSDGWIPCVTFTDMKKDDITKGCHELEQQGFIKIICFQGQDKIECYVLF